MANIYDKRSVQHAGFDEGTKVETIVDHHEVNGDLSSGTILTVVSIAHYPTRIIAVDNNGLEWTLPLHSVKKYGKDKSTVGIDESNKEEAL